MDRHNNKNRAGRSRASFGFCLAFLSVRALAAGVEVDGASNTTLDAAPNGVPVVNIAKPDAAGLSHNTYRRFNVDTKGLILNNGNQSVVDTQLGGKIFGNAQLVDPARVILNEVTSTNRSLLEGYTEVAGQRADVVIANPNGISVNGAGFINVPRVTLTTGLPQFDADGRLSGFDIHGGDIAIGGAGLDGGAQDSVSIYTHFLELNARLHAKDLDILLGPNEVDYPGRRITSTRADTAGRVVLDSSALGGMYAGKIKLVGTAKGLGMHLPPEVVASNGPIQINNDGRIVLRQLDATGNIEIASSGDVDSSDTVYSRAAIDIESASAIRVDDGMIAARNRVSLGADTFDNAARLVAGLESDGGTNAWGELEIAATTIDNRGELIGTNILALHAVDFANSGLVNTGGLITVDADSLTNEGTLFADTALNLFIAERFENRTGATIVAVGDLTLAADAGGAKTAMIRNDRGLIQTLQGDIEIHASAFDNLGLADIRYDLVYHDLARDREVSSPGAAMTIDLRYSTGYTKHKSTARRRWVDEVLSRLGRQAPALYNDNVANIRNNLAARFDAIETRLIDYSTTDPALLDSGGNLTLDVDDFKNRDSVVSASGDIRLDISGDYANQASGDSVRVTDYQYFTRAEHDRNSWSDDKYSSRGSRSGYAAVNRTKRVSSNTVTQAGGDISGTIGGQLVNAGAILQGRHESRPGVDPSVFDPAAIALPSGDFGLFVRTPDPESAYLIETNPRFTRFSEFVGSGYLLERLDYSADMNLKRLGDAFYESKLIRDSVLAQSGRRYLDATISSDIAQFQYLMDNALAAQRDLELAPGVALNADQITRLTKDIVWLEPYEIDGEAVLVPRVYLANSRRDPVRGGRIVAGSNTALQVAGLANGGLIETGDDIELDVGTGVSNTGVIAAGVALAIDASGDIENVSGRIEGADVALTSTDGDIVNRRRVESSHHSARDLDYSVTMLGVAGVIAGRDSITLDAAGAVHVEGSRIEGGAVRLQGERVAIDAAAQDESFAAGDDDDYWRESELAHVASTIVGDEIVILATGDARLSGSSLDADDELRIAAGAIDVAGVNDESHYASKSSLDGIASERVETKHRYRSNHRASELDGAIVVLVTEHGDIELSGSEVRAGTRLILDSADDISVVAGRDASLDEQHKYKSSWFSGNSLYTEEEKLAGRIAETAVKSTLGADRVEMRAVADVELVGVDAVVADEFGVSAGRITIENATSEKTIYSKHTRVNLGFDDVVSNLSNLGDFVEEEDGKLKLRLGEASYEHAESVTTETTAVASQIAAGNIALSTNGDSSGDIRVEGSDLYADETITLDASGDVALLDAVHTREHEALTRNGTAEINVTLQNEYDQLARAVKAVRSAESDLRHARDALDDYEDELARQEAEFRQLERDFDRGIGFVERADLDDFERRLERLRDDEDFYRTNIALAAATLATRTTQALKQGGRAAASGGTLGFNASLELDIDALERQVDEFFRDSRATTLAAAKIDIRAGDSATIRGSMLDARERIDILAENIEIIAGASESRADEREQHLSYSHRWDALQMSSASFGVPESVGGLDENDLGGSLSGGGSLSEYESKFHVNSRLTAAEIRLQADDDTSIEGAQIHAVDSLEIESGNLEIVSVQDEAYSESRSLGMSYAGSGHGLDAADGESELRRTRITQVVGGRVRISVHDHTDIRGAVVASVDADGADRGELSLETNTLSAGSLINTIDKSSRSLGVSAGEFSSLDYTDDAEFGRTKTLATLGEGTIAIGDAEKSDTRFLNTDIENTEISVYELESQRELSGELDTRFLTENGRKAISEDLKRTELMGSALLDVVREESVRLQDTLQHIGDVQKDFDVQKLMATQDGGVNAQILNNLATATTEEKQQAINAFAAAYAQIYKIDIDQATVIAVNVFVGGAFTNSNGDHRIYINDNAQKNALDYVKTLGHEVTHAQIAQDESIDRGSHRLNEDYAEIRGDYAAENYAFNFSSNELGTVKTGSTNANIGNDYTTTEESNLQYYQEDQGQLEYSCMHSATQGCVDLALEQAVLAHMILGNEERAAELIEVDILAGYLEWGNEEKLTKALETASPGVIQEALDLQLNRQRENQANMIAGGIVATIVLAPATPAIMSGMIQAGRISAAELAAFASNPINYCRFNANLCLSVAEEAGYTAAGATALSSVVPDVPVSSIKNVIDDVSEAISKNADELTDVVKTREGTKEIFGIGADVNYTGLPNGYSYVVTADGEHVIQGPRGGIYTPTDYFDSNGNPLYLNSNKLYSLDQKLQFVPNRDLGNASFNKIFASGADKAIFWSGIGRGSSTEAAKYAEKYGGVTLESTIADRNIRLPAWDPTDPSSVAAWRQASREFAMGAKGHVRVLQGNRLRINSIWGDVEFPALKENPNVKSITSVDLATGSEVLLWSR